MSPNHGKLLHLLAKVQGAKEDSRDRHARRLQHDLAGSGARSRWPSHHARERSAACRRRPRQPRERWLGADRPGSRRRGARYAATTRGRGPRSVRLDLHRCGQSKYTIVFQVGADTVATRRPHRGRQRRKGRCRRRCIEHRSGRAGCVSSSSWCDPSRGWKRLRFQTAVRSKATMASHS